MKKIFILLMLLCVSSVYAGYAFPIFDGNRGHWITYESEGTSIEVESGTWIGLTNPHVGDTDIHFIFKTDSTDFIFDLSFVESSGVTVVCNGKELYMDGIHDGPGDIVSFVYMNGNAIVDVYERMPNMVDYEKIGSFAVGNLVPEPSTLVLLFVGTILTRRSR